jgi:hypothetical protein
MSMIIDQKFMEINVINPMARRLAEIEKKIDKLMDKRLINDDGCCECAETKPETKPVKKVK